MTVGDYIYYCKYLIGLEKYHELTLKKYNYSKLVKLCKEIERVKELLYKSRIVKLVNK